MATAGRKAAPKTKVRRKEKKNVVAGQAHIKSTFNFRCGDLVGLCRHRRLQGLS